MLRNVVSRAHVRTIPQEASALGLVARSDGDGRYRALPLLIHAMRRFFAAMFQLHIYALDRALAQRPGQEFLDICRKLI
ncbi:MAG: hypothetical protein H7251_16110 [Acetobacteraceae bacterium]|nr:hypothetical protein [Acetobacteraceae bacterium]